MKISENNVPKRFQRKEKLKIAITSHSPKVYRINPIYLPKKTFRSQGYSLNFPTGHYNEQYARKASAYLNKGFDGVKDFTRNTAKSGLSFGEKLALWLFNKISYWSKNWFTHIFLLFVILVNSFLGAFMFMVIEGNAEKIKIEQLNKERNIFLDEIKSLTLDIHSKITEEEWYAASVNILRRYEDQMYNEFLNGRSLKKVWTFWNSLFFCGTVYTTIGYGHIYPITTTGKALTIIYAIFGIPLFLIILTDFGKLFTRGIKFLWAFVRRLYYTGSCRRVRRNSQIQDVMRNVKQYVQIHRSSQQNNITDCLENETNLTPVPSNYEINDEFNLPISVAFLILIAYILFGAFIYSSLENWTFFESFYFVFISMSTIGFGDYVPQHPMYMITSIVYLIFGLALTSMFINVVQLKLTDAFQKASTKLSSTMGFNDESNTIELESCQ